MKLFLLHLPLIALFAVLAESPGLKAQPSIDTITPVKKFSFFGVPLAFYSPDTKWGGGAAGIFTFPGNPLRSSITFSFAYTQRRQVLAWIPFQWYHRNGNWRAYGELGWYRYLYQYFGVGNEYPDDFLETYTARFPRVRWTVARRWRDSRHFFGLRYNLDDYHISEATPGGDLATGNIPGARGGFSSSPGIVWLYDSRDSPFFPSKGILTESSVVFENRISGSDFRYARWTGEVSAYQKIGRNILAVNALAVFTTAGAPFFLMPQLGGTRRLRGYPDGRFRDKHMVLIQAEGRVPLFWRLKAVAFGGVGSVFGTGGETVLLHSNLGAGLRFEFDKKQKINIRFDYGFGIGTPHSGAYLTVGEAF